MLMVFFSRCVPASDRQASDRRNVRRQSYHGPIPDLHPDPHALEIQSKADQEGRYYHRSQRRYFHPRLRNTEKCLLASRE